MHNPFTGKNAPKWLLASLLLNMFLLGGAAAPLFFQPIPSPPPLTPPPPRLMVERLSESLSDDGRHDLLRALDEAQPQLDQLFDALNRTQNDLMDVFAAETFDESGYRQALDNRKAAADEFFSRMSDFFMQAGKDLSVQDRRRITERGRI
nr:periplasmic heavy metal sensor [uncultured Dongia sp.]